MALLKLVEFVPKYSNKYSFKSFSKNSVYVLLLKNFHTSKIILNQNNPIKYTTSKAAQLNFPNTRPSSEKQLWYQNYVIIGSVAAFLLYFLYLREENDIDEIFKGTSENSEEYSNLFHLEMKLRYCEQNNLPTQNIKNKIKNLKKELGIKDWD